MAEVTSSSDTLVINAPVEKIKEVLLDFESYPDWMKNVEKTEIVKKDSKGRGKHVKYTVDAMVVNLIYTMNYEYTDDEFIITYVEGSLKDANAKYTFEPIDDDSTSVTYEFGANITIPIPGIKKIATKTANKMIISSALKDLKKRVESLP